MASKPSLYVEIYTEIWVPIQSLCSNGPECMTFGIPYYNRPWLTDIQRVLLSMCKWRC